MQTVKRKNILVLSTIVVLVACLLALTVYPSSIVQTTQSSSTKLEGALNEATASIYVKVYSPSGSLIAERSSQNDLILNGFNYYLLSLLGSGATGAGCSSRPGLVQYACLAVGSTSSSCPSSPGACGVELGIGTDNTAAVRTDFQLGDQYGSLFADNGVNAAPTMTADPSLCYSATTDAVYDINGTTTAGSTATITEAGAFLTGYNTVSAGHNGLYSLMIFHDVFSGIHVTTGDAIQVSYQLNLENPGFTDNICYLLAGILTGNIETGGATTDIYMRTTGNAYGGAAEAFLTWCSSGGDVVVASVGCGDATQGSYESIGTGSTPYTPASYNLTSRVDGYEYPATTGYFATTGTATLYWTSTFTITGSNTIKEAGFFLYLTLDSTSSFFMLYALTFSGAEQVSTVPFGISLWITD